jgi:hypothetical protein
MARRAITAPADGKRPRPLVSVLVGYETFRDRICELADGTVLGPGTVATLLHDALIERVVFDGPSRVIDVGRARRFTGAVRRALEVLDRGCTHGGCDMPVERWQGDHVQPWSEAAPRTSTTDNPVVVTTTAGAGITMTVTLRLPLPNGPHPAPISKDARHGSKGGAPDSGPAGSPSPLRSRADRAVRAAYPWEFGGRRPAPRLGSPGTLTAMSQEDLLIRSGPKGRRTRRMTGTSTSTVRRLAGGYSASSSARMA